MAAKDLGPLMSTPPEAGTVHGFLAQFRAEGAPSDIFGPAVPVPSDAPLFDLAIGLPGRDPRWRGGLGQTTPAATAASAQPVRR